MTKALWCVAIAMLGLTLGTPLTAQQGLRLRNVSSGRYLTRFPNGSLGSTEDSLSKPNPDSNSHWVFEPIPRSDQFHIRNVGSGLYLTADSIGAWLHEGPRYNAQRWNLEPDAKYPNVYFRLTTHDGRYFDGGGLRMVVNARASIPADQFWFYAFAFDSVNGKPAPRSVVMTANQIDSANRHVALVTAMRSAHGCWRVDSPNANERVFAFAFNGDSLVLYSLRFTEAVSGGRDFIMEGHSLGTHWGVFRPRNGGLTTDDGVALTLYDHTALRVQESRSDHFQRLPFSLKSSATGITQEECLRLLSEALTR